MHVDDFRGMYLPHARVLVAQFELGIATDPRGVGFLPPLRKPKAFWEPSFPFHLLSHHRRISALTNSTLPFFTNCLSGS